MQCVSCCIPVNKLSRKRFVKHKRRSSIAQLRSEFIQGAKTASPRTVWHELENMYMGLRSWVATQKPRGSAANWKQTTTVCKPSQRKEYWAVETCDMVREVEIPRSYSRVRTSPREARIAWGSGSFPPGHSIAYKCLYPWSVTFNGFCWTTMKDSLPVVLGFWLC